MPSHYNDNVSSSKAPEAQDVKSTQEEENQVGDLDVNGLANQVQVEYDLCWRNQESRINKQLIRLRLYNNQRKDEDTVGDNTIFTVMQTVLASLYKDRLQVTFKGREEGDDEVAENWNGLAEFDYKEMDKDVVDFIWDWDTLFNGRGFVDMSEFVRDPENGVFVPSPRNIDPFTFLHDPRATSINGVTRKMHGASRFHGRTIKMTMVQMEKHPSFFDSQLDGLTHEWSVDDLVKKAEQARSDAQGLQQPPHGNDSNLGEGAEHDILEWETHWEVDGKDQKIKVWIANQRTKVVGFQVIKSPWWQIADRSLYPTAHLWDGVSVPDITEDKQRGRAIITNLSLQAMQADLYPSYIYDTNKIKNKNQLGWGYNKFTGVDGPTDGAIQPVRKAAFNLGMIDYVFQTLGQSAQEATATSDVQRGGLSEQERTLGEINLSSEKTATRYSLSAKIFGWSESWFWKMWQWSYKEYFADNIDKKIIRIEGAFGAKHRPITKKDMQTNYDPDIEIESVDVARAENLLKLQSLQGYLNVVLSDPTANRRYALKKMGKLHGLGTDEMTRLLPPTIEELLAEEENDLLNEDKFVRVLPDQDHTLHLEMLGKAKETDAKMAHMEAHKAALTLQRTNPELFPNLQADEERVFAGSSTPQLDGQTQNPQSALPQQRPQATTQPPNATIGTQPL